ncbi:hypothetical protein E2C01_070793 [Portunus trituberculatus]|uniref:Uncharacterized protein n=1 Tax=Portunus trituberculatus TaxID=210409 RepID=A0A5B7I2A4_PORTR|nr:hypothetical protein [Portunus trituberculatus]
MPVCIGEVQGGQPRVRKKGLPDLLERHHPEVMTLDVGVESRKVDDQSRVLPVPPRDQEGTGQEDRAGILLQYPLEEHLLQYCRELRRC